MYGSMHMGNAAAMGPDMGKCKGAAERVFAIVDYPSQINAQETAKIKESVKVNMETFEGRIEMKDVWFRYPSRKEDFVLRGLNLKIEPKESIALVGESGCGKSTFVNLIMRFYDVDSGVVLIDGIDIRDYDLHSLRMAISMVMQEPLIFNYSILENVLYGKNNARNSEILEACTQANAMEFINGKVMEFEDTAQALIKDMEEHESKIREMITDAKYDEEMKVLKIIAENDVKKGSFEALGDVDARDKHLIDVELSTGFDNLCGIRGDKLSGG